MSRSGSPRRPRPRTSSFMRSSRRAAWCAHHRIIWRATGNRWHPRTSPITPCLHYGYLATGNTWTFAGPDGDHSVHVNGVICSNNGQVLRDAAIAGQGIVHFADFHCRRRSARRPAAVGSGRLRAAAPCDLRALPAKQASISQDQAVHGFHDRALCRTALLGSGRVKNLTV